jgi:hypothetical protein
MDPGLLHIHPHLGGGVEGQQDQIPGVAHVEGWGPRQGTPGLAVGTGLQPDGVGHLLEPVAQQLPQACPTQQKAQTVCGAAVGLVALDIYRRKATLEGPARRQGQAAIDQQQEGGRGAEW